MILQLLSVFIGVVGFGIILEVPKKYLTYSGIAGTVGWAAFLLGQQLLPVGSVCIFDSRNLSICAWSRNLSHGLLSDHRFQVYGELLSGGNFNYSGNDCFRYLYCRYFVETEKSTLTGI